MWQLGKFKVKFMDFDEDHSGVSVAPFCVFAWLFSCTCVAHTPDFPTQDIDMMELKRMMEKL